MMTVNETSLSLRCMETTVLDVKPIWTWENTAIQLVRKENGTDTVVSEMATEYLFGSFFLLLSLCLTVFVIYICIVFWVRYRRKGSYIHAMQAVNEQLKEIQVV